MRFAIVLLGPVLLALATLGCSQEEAEEKEPNATATVAATEEPVVQPTSPQAVAATATNEPPAPTPTEPQIMNRMSCAAINGTAYLSDEERQWYQANCVVEEPPPQQPPGGQQPPQSCHPSYVGACLLPNASDYDCAGGSGNGPYYTGPVQVVGPDVYDLDRDNDGLGCE